ncbi:MAG: hypothetical protein LBU70_01980 [Chitinispirillales bacterium]|jgi:shikimate kinase|nr:hypothetical protein [Chitinispirillales bacterium]
MAIILIGFASSGKSATGDAVSQATGMKHVDLDRVIEDLYERRYERRLSCRDVFKDLGICGFTELERDALHSLTGMCDTVLSTGGRTPMCEDNRAFLKSLGRIVYLKCGIDTILMRMKDKGYPQSMGGSAEGVRAEWKVRDPVYSEFADIIIDNDEMTPNETARVIQESI